MYRLNMNYVGRIGGRKAPKGGQDKLEVLLDNCNLLNWIQGDLPDLGSNRKFLLDISKYKLDEFEDTCAEEMSTTSKGIDFISFRAGTDWQIPVLICIYWDGKNYRGYVPTRGNLINTLSKAPIGGTDGWEDDREKDIEYLKKELKLDHIKTVKLDGSSIDGWEKGDEDEFEEIKNQLELDYDSCLKEFEDRLECID